MKPIADDGLTVYSPMVGGSGAVVVHQQLQRHIKGYEVEMFSPIFASLPFAPFFMRKDAALIHTIPDLGAGPLSLKAAVVLTVHNYYLDDFMLARSSLAQKLYYRTILRRRFRSALARADRIIAVSDFTASLITKFHSAKHVEVIKNGVAEQVFCPAAPLTQRERVRVLFSGNPSSRKGIGTLKSIAEKLGADVELWVTGGLRNLNEFGDLPINFLGRIPYESMPDLYRDVDILFLPTIREGLSLAVLEAMASGLPVVATDISSMSELIVHGHGGYLFQLDDANGALTSLRTLATNRGLREQMGAFNRQRVMEHFREERMVQDYLTIFRELRR